MPLYLYKCNICNRTVEEFRKVDEREEVKKCSDFIFTQPDVELIAPKLYSGELQGENGVFICPGSLIFQPMQKTNFTMNHLND